MKKLIALLSVMAVFSTTVFAAPLSLAASPGNDFPVKNEAAQELDLFADVWATRLTDIEANEVEGNGPIGAFIGFVIGSYVASQVMPAISSAITSQVINQSAFNRLVRQPGWLSHKSCSFSG